MLTRGKLAQRTGCNIETVRYHEKVGLLPEPARSDAGYRMYTDEHEKRLRFILRAKELGFTGVSIRNLLMISDAGDDYTRAEVKALTEAHIEEVSEKIRDLQKLKKQLNQISAHCDGSAKSAKSCPIMTNLFGEVEIKH